jgi:rhodanese-related sulfurtransferase
MDAEISAVSLHELSRALLPQPQIIDVRGEDTFARDRRMIPGAVRRSPDIAQWQSALEPWRAVVVYCDHGDEASRNAATMTRERGYDARHLAGGFAAWAREGLPLVSFSPPTRWVTRERPKIDRIACPWLIRRFIDPAAEFFYVPARDVLQFAETGAATPYDVPDVAYSHDGPACSFDAFIRRHALRDDALDMLATIVRGADTAALDLAPQASGLLAISLGLSQMFADDHAMLRFGMLVYDALYAWCREAAREAHGWNPAALRQAMASSAREA